MMKDNDRLMKEVIWGIHGAMKIKGPMYRITATVSTNNPWHSLTSISVLAT